MKVNELRIGVWIIDTYADGSEYETQADIAQIEYSHNCKGIELTDGWLLKLGFEQKDITKWHGNGQDYQPEDVYTEQLDFVKKVPGAEDFIFRFENWSFPGHDSISTSVHYGDWYPKIYEFIPAAEVKYVHQLQNLYFALTGEELTLQQ